MNTYFYPSPKNLEEMLDEIAEKNKIASFSLPVYEQSPLPLSYENPELIDVHDFSRIVSVNSSTLKNEKFRFSKMNRKPNHVVGLSSEVILENGVIAHLRQLDIDITGGIGGALDKLQSILEFLYRDRKVGGLNFEGYVVFSGQGHHFYGNDLMTQEQWKEWIERAREHPDIENNWCDIQLRRGFSILRLTSSEIKGFDPKVFYHVQRY